MTEFDTEIIDSISKPLQIASDVLGLQKSAGAVLSTLYASDFNSGERLSSKDISDATGLSRSMISMVLSQFESLGIIETYLDSSKKKGGRRTMLFSLRVGIHGLLSLGIQRYLGQVQRVLGDLEDLKSSLESNDVNLRMVLDRVMSELVLFLTDPCGI